MNFPLFLIQVQDLRVTQDEMKLILRMYRHETIDSRDVMEAREAEYRAWAHVQSLKSSLDEHNLEIRVKTANESEARSQQNLVAAEAEIADMRHKLDDSKREMCKMSDGLRSKNEENEAYLSEIETIGQAYDDMQTQNQHLLHQITERDDYNINLVLEGVRARQKQDYLIIEKRLMEQENKQSNVSLNLCNTKAARIEDQIRFKNLRTTNFKILAVWKTPKEDCRILYHHRNRFAQKTVEEDLEVARRNLSQLKAQNEDSSVTDKL
ncbi:hypothetical protein RYX36_002507 [Vicia faba]